MVTTADSAVSAGYTLLGQLALKVQRLLGCNELVIGVLSAEGELRVGGAVGTAELRGGEVIPPLAPSRRPDGEQDFVSIWDDPVRIAGLDLKNAAVFMLIVQSTELVHLGYLIAGGRSGGFTAEDLSLGWISARQIVSVISLHFRPSS